MNINEFKVGYDFFERRKHIENEVFVEMTTHPPPADIADEYEWRLRLEVTRRYDAKREADAWLWKMQTQLAKVPR